MSRNPGIGVLAWGGVIATVTAAAVWAGARAVASPLPATNYSGGAVSFSKTGSGSATVQTGTYANKTGKPICDFVVGPQPGQGAGNVTGIGAASSFRFDDNGNGNVNDQTGNPPQDTETNTTDDDGNYSTTGRSIAKTTCIAKDAEFTLSITISSESSVNMQWQATGQGSGAGIGGSQFAALQIVNDSSGTQTATIYNAYGIHGVIVLGKNGDESGLVSVTFAPPTGVTISSVGDADNPGTWNSSTKTYTFTTPLSSASEFQLDVIVDGASAGETTLIQWTPNY